MGGIDIFADNKRLDYNFICTSPDKAIKNDWSNIWNKFGFIRFGSGINKVLLYSSWDTKGKIYNFHSALVEKNELNEEDYEFSYIWHGIYFPITYKSGEKGPIIHTNILSKLKRHDQYYRAEKYIKISKEKKYSVMNGLAMNLEQAILAFQYNNRSDLQITRSGMDQVE